MASEKTYRVIFKKNNGHGKRTRVNYKTSNLTELSEAITATAKDERYRPMRVQEMNGSDINTRYKIKLVEGEYDITKAKDRVVTEITKAVEADTTKIKEVTKTKEAPKAATKKPKDEAPITKKITAKQAAMADMEDDGISFDVN